MSEDITPELDTIRDVLESDQSLNDLLEVRNHTEILRKHAVNARLGLDIENQATEIKLRAERILGQKLSALHLQGGDRKSKNRDHVLTLTALGISRNQSTRFQREASVPESEFLEYIDATSAASVRLSSAGLIRLAKQFSIPERNAGEAKRRHGGVDFAVANQQSLSDVSERAEATKIVAELSGHRQILENLFGMKPSDLSGDSIGTMEHRLIERYLCDMRTLLKELQGILAE